MTKRTPAQQAQFDAAEAINRELYGSSALPEDQLGDTTLEVQKDMIGHKAPKIGEKEESVDG